METCFTIWETTLAWLNKKTDDLQVYERVETFLATETQRALSAKMEDALAQQDAKQMKHLCGLYCRVFLEHVKKTT